jgi:hypothetical protein
VSVILDKELFKNYLDDYLKFTDSKAVEKFIKLLIAKIEHGDFNVSE